MQRVYILCGDIRQTRVIYQTHVIYGYYKSYDGAFAALQRQELCFGAKGYSNRYAAPFFGEEVARELFGPETGEIYGRLSIQSNILND